MWEGYPKDEVNFQPPNPKSSITINLLQSGESSTTEILAQPLAEDKLSEDDEQEDFLKKSLNGGHSKLGLSSEASKYGSFLGEMSPGQETMEDKDKMEVAAEIVQGNHEY